MQATDANLKPLDEITDPASRMDEVLTEMCESPRAVYEHDELVAAICALTARVSELEAWKARFKGTTLGYYDVSEEEWEKMRAANERTNDGSV